MTIAIVNWISWAAAEGHLARIGRQAKHRPEEICGPALIIGGLGLFLILATLIPA
jgi:hypothetical protein